MTAHELDSMLRDVNHLQECIIEDVLWKKYGTSIDILLKCPVKEVDEGGLNVSFVNRVLAFTHVQNFCIDNQLSNRIMSNIDEINWGLSEFAIARRLENSKLVAQFENPPVELHHIEFSWEAERQIDIVFGDLEIESV